MSNYMTDMLVRIKHDLPCNIIHITHTDNDGYTCAVVNQFFTRSTKNVNVHTYHINTASELMSNLDPEIDTNLGTVLFHCSEQILYQYSVPTYVLITDISNIGMKHIKGLYRYLDIRHREYYNNKNHPYKKSVLKCAVKIIILDHHISSEKFRDEVERYNEDADDFINTYPVQYITNCSYAACKIMLRHYTNVCAYSNALQYMNEYYLHEIVEAVSANDVGDIELYDPSMPDFIYYGLRMYMNLLFNVHKNEFSDHDNTLSGYVDNVLDVIDSAVIKQQNDFNNRTNNPKSALISLFWMFPYKNIIYPEFCRISEMYKVFTKNLITNMDEQYLSTDIGNTITAAKEIVPENLHDKTVIYQDDPDHPLQFFSMIAKSYLTQHPEVELIVAFFYKEGSVSLRMLNATVNDEVNCSTIAAKYGGGGHPCAGGFPMNALNRDLKYVKPIKFNKLTKPVYIDQSKSVIKKESVNDQHGTETN